MLSPFGVEIVSAGELGLPAPEETGTTFEDNATLKALAATRASGLPALADDSGLSVQALDGQPGLYTADWEGPTRDAMVGMRRIQDELAARKVPDTDAARAATFHCVLALAWPDEHVELVHGTLDGRIVWPPRGSGGHGYDPCFQPKGDTRTTAEMTRRREERHQPSRPRLPACWSRPASDERAALGVYVHWPFCKSKCPYCDFNSHVRDGVEQDALARRAAEGAGARRARGAGPPGRDDLLRRRHAVADGARDRGRRDRAHQGAVGHARPSVEITLEANPTSVEAGRFAALAEAGVNRVSLGVQALDAPSLRFLGREHSADEAIAAIATARRHFARYSFDLIYARPGQTVDAWAAELERALASPASTSRSISSPSSAARASSPTMRAAPSPCRARTRRRRCSSSPRRGSRRPACRPTRSPTMPGRGLPAAII